MRDTGVLALVEEIYAAVLDDSAWERVMRRVVAAVGGEGGALAVQDMRSHRLTSAVWVGEAATRLSSSYDQHVAAQNVLWQRTATAPVGSVFTDNMVLPGNGIRRYDFFHEVVRPLGIGNVMAAIVQRDGHLSGSATVLRALDRPDFTDDEVRLMAALAPHLARALTIRKRMAVSEREAATSRAALERLTSAVLFVDRQRRVEVANGAAEQLLRCAEGLRVVHGVIACHDPRETQALWRALDDAAAGRGAEAALAITRPLGLRPLSALVAPLPAGRSWLPEEGPVALLVVTDPDVPAVSTPDLLGALYGLTPAEARVAIALSEGERPAELADRLGVSVATVRTHMQRAFAKTGTRRQSELVRIVLTHGPSVSPPARSRCAR